MGATNIERRKEYLLANRIAQLEQDVAALKTNQIQRVSFGNIILDGRTTNGNLYTNNSPIITGAGLSSTLNFPLSGHKIPSSQTTSSSTPVDISGSSLSPFNTTATETNVLIAADVQGFVGPPSDNITGTGVVDIVDSVNNTIGSFPVTGDFFLDSITQNGSGFITDWFYEYTAQIVTVTFITTLSSGSHTLKLQYSCVNGGSFSIIAFSLAYVVLGQQQQK